MRQIVTAFAFLLLTAIGASAQTTTPRVEWQQPLVTGQTPADFGVSATYTLKIDTGTPVALTHTCTGTVSPLSCSAPLTAAQVPAAGTHRYELAVTNAFGSAVFAQTGAAPAVPGGLKIVITITVPAEH